MRELSRLGSWYGSLAATTVFLGLLFGAASLLQPDGELRLWCEIAVASAAFYVIALALGKWARAEDKLHTAEQAHTVVRRETADLHNSELLKDELVRARTMRIFASRSSTYHQYFRTGLRGIARDRPLVIRVLMRDSGRTDRRSELVKECRKWRELSNLYPHVSVEVGLYSFRRMWRGVIFDDRAGLIGWYDRTHGSTSGQEHELRVLRVEEPDERASLRVLSDIFDEAFALGSDLSVLEHAQSRRVVVFDLDGTLYETDALDRENERAVLTALSEHRAIDKPQARQLLSETRDSSPSTAQVSLLEATQILGIPADVLRRHQNAMIQPEEHLEPDPEVVDLVRDVGTSCGVAVLTNAPREIASRALRAMGFSNEDFDVVRTGDEVTSAKPNPVELARVVHSAGGALRLSVSLGDRFDVDLAPAIELGMDTKLISSRKDLITWLKAEHAGEH